MVLVKSVELDLSVKGDAESKAKLDEISKRAEALKRAFPTYALKIDSAAASERLRVFKLQLAEAAKTVTANVKVKVDDSELQKLADKLKKAGGGPSWLAPALALTPAIATVGGVGAGAAIGLAGAFTAGAGALAAFGAVAKPVLTSALTASQAVNTAQNTYNATIAAGVPKAQAQATLQAANANAQLTYNAALAGGAKPATALAAYHLALAKNQLAYNSATNAGTFNAKAYAAEQLAISKAYADLSPAQIALSKQLGVMANAWQDLKAAQTPVVAGALVPWLKSVTDLTKNLGPIIAYVSPWIASLGRQFDALIRSPAFTAFRDFIAGTGSAAVGVIGGTLIDFLKAGMILLVDFNPLIEKTIQWIGGLGPAVLKWASSKKTADDITKFMAWFSTNGPVVGDLLKNIGKALATLAPGLTAGGAAELKVISDFFGWVARLPKGIAAPLAEVAGALLLMNKLGVFSVGVKLIGLGGAGGIAGAAGLWSKLLPGVALIGGALVATIIVKTLLGAASSGLKPGQNPWDNPFGADPKSKDTAKQGISTWAGLGNQITQIWDLMWRNTITRTAKGFHDLAGWFDTGRHDVAAHANEITSDLIDAWDLVWRNTITRTAKGFHDLAGWFDTGRHDVAAHANEITSDLIDAWDLVWRNTITRTAKGFHDLAGWFDTGRHDIAHVWDVLMTDITASWDIAKEEIRITWDKIKILFLQGVDSILTTMGRLPGPLGAPFRAAHKTVQAEMAGIQRDVGAAMGNVQRDIDRIHGKSVNVLVIGSGTGTINFNETTGVGQMVSGGLKFMAGGGMGPALAVVGEQGPELVSLPPGSRVFSHGQSAAMIPGIPGFAAGGMITNTGGVPWMSGVEAGFARTVEGNFAKAAVAKLKAAVAAAAKAAAGMANPGGAGVARWIPAINAALGLLGLAHEPFALLTTLSQMNTESAGNPTIVNKWDSNWAAGTPSVGLMQVIGPTYRAYAGPFRNTGPFEYGVSTNGEANIYAGLNYAIHRYGNPGWLSVLGHGHGYDSGGLLMPGLTLAWNGTGRPEQVIPASRGTGGPPVIFQIEGGGARGTFDAFLLKWLQEHVRVRGGGSVQTAFGHRLSVLE